MIDGHRRFENQLHPRLVSLKKNSRRLSQTRVQRETLRSEKWSIHTEHPSLINTQANNRCIIHNFNGIRNKTRERAQFPRILDKRY